MTDLEASFESRTRVGAQGNSSLSPGYPIFHWFMMAGFIAFYALLLPINQRWFSHEAVRGLLWWTALGLGLILLGGVVAACIVHWSTMTHAERVNRAWIISFVLLIFLGELFRRHSLWVEWMELPLTLVCGAWDGGLFTSVSRITRSGPIVRSARSCGSVPRKSALARARRSRPYKRLSGNLF